MKKKLAFVLSLCFMMLMLGACGTDPTTVDYNGVSYDELKSYSENWITSLAQSSDDQLEYAISSGSMDEATIAMMEKWMESTEDVGEFVGFGKFKIEKSGTTLTTDQIVNCENRDVDFQVVINYADMTITGYTIEPVYSLGEKMAKAGLNTLISISIVFVVLILISLIIYCFNIFPYLEKKKKAKAANSLTTDVASTVDEEVAEQSPMDDTELVAVIAAAIAASTGSSTSDFVVRSINRR